MDKIKNLINHIAYLIRKITIKFEKRFNISLYFLFPNRINFRKIELSKTRPINNLNNYSVLYNYCIVEPKKEINIISGGIGTNIKFEEECILRLDIKKMVMLDPTNIGEKTAEKITNESISFIKKPIFINNEKIKVFVPHEKDNSNYSIENLYATSNYTFLETITVEEIMKHNNIDHIDILKLDIEGVADTVIKDLLSKNIFPDQICFELEKSVNLFVQKKIFLRISAFLDYLNKYYDVYSMTDLKIGMRMDLLAIKKGINL